MSARRILSLSLLAMFLIAIPFVATPFLVVQIAIKSLWLGTVAASLTFLVRYGGMVSLAQTAVYGTAGYVTANLAALHGVNGWLAAAVGILAGTVLAALVALVAVRSQGIYFLMLTLAAGVFVFYFALQYRPFTQGFGGINGVSPPALGQVSLRDPTTFYFLAVVVAVVATAAMRGYAGSPLGLALEGVRDSPERMRSLGYHVPTIRVLSFSFAGLIASTAGILAVWYNGRISPGSIDLTRTIDVLVVAVIGGITRIEGAWLGALVVTLLANYATDYTDRANTVVGLIFIAVVLLSPRGILGLPEGAAWLHRRLRRQPAPTPSG